MKSKCGLRFLLVAVLLSAFSIWFLPVNSATTDIFLLLAGRTSIRTKTVTESYEDSTYATHDVNTRDLDTNITVAVTLLAKPEEVTDIQGSSYNSTLSDKDTQSAFIPSKDTSPTRNSLYALLEFTTFNPVTESNTDKQSFTVPDLNTQDTNSSGIVTPEPSLAPEFSTAGMGDNQTACIRSTGITEAEVLAIVVGAVFMTILLSALLYQLAVYMKKKKTKRPSSVYIIENELHKYDMEANGDTRL
ncbi:uncharacterized protein LOC134612577 [Pelobates fuscus]|uniref:uncharacterized protein LOC134612577 n=1 Tax=Pelobates fuscus TaxID=191477 RepID=UPI002FE453FC